MTRGPADMSREELIRELEKLEDVARRDAASAGVDDRERLIHDLHVHQIELEIQNRELRAAQERLEEAHERYADLYDAAPIGYATLDPAGVILQINQTGAGMLGVPRDVLIDRPLSGFVVAEDRRALRGHLQACRGATGRVTGEVTLLRGKDAGPTVQLVSEAVAEGFRVILVDVSAVRRLEHQLRLQLTRAGEEIAASLDRAGIVDAAAGAAVPALADLFMVDVVEDGALERAAVVLADPDRAALADRLRRWPSRPGWQSPQARAIASGEPMLLEEVPEPAARGPDAAEDLTRIADVRAMIVMPLIARGRTLGALTLAAIEPGRRYTPSDLELARELASRVAQALDNARLYAEARRAVASRDAMMAVVSHDLGGLLTVVTMSTSLALERIEPRGPDEALHRALAAALRSAGRMSRLIQDLLDVSSIESGTFSAVLRRQLTGPLVVEAVDALRPHAATRSLALELELPAGGPLAIDADRDRVLQVLDNLIGNAIKFTEPGGTITVRVEPRGREVWFLVANTGAGIAPDDLPHVFERFWKGRRSARSGTGLGLAIAKGIVEAHRGRIWVESEPGAGTRFWFALPLAAEPVEDAGGPAGAPVARRGILLVEDSLEVRDALAVTFTRAGYDVEVASNGAEALARLQHGLQPALIVVDLLMPVMDGWAFLAERAREPRLRSIPVLVMSGERDIAGQLADLDAAHLEKPATPESLLEAVAHLIG